MIFRLILNLWFLIAFQLVTLSGNWEFKCDPGFIGLNCSEKCTKGKFGDFCSEDCLCDKENTIECNNGKLIYFF